MSGAPEPTPTPNLEPALGSSLITGEPKAPEPSSPEPKPEGEAPKVEEPKALTTEDLKLSEGATLDPVAAEGFLAIANELKLPAEASQKLFDYGSQLLEKASAAGTEAFVKMNEQWATECKTDKEFGGEKLEANLASVAKLLDNPKFADPELRSALLLTGAGNHPAVFRSFVRMAQALAEGTPVSGSAAQVSRPQTFGEALYGKNPS